MQNEKHKGKIKSTRVVFPPPPAPLITSGTTQCACLVRLCPVDSTSVSKKLFQSHGYSYWRPPRWLKRLWQLAGAFLWRSHLAGGRASGYTAALVRRRAQASRPKPDLHKSNCLIIPSLTQKAKRTRPFYQFLATGCCAASCCCEHHKVSPDSPPSDLYFKTQNYAKWGCCGDVDRCDSLGGFSSARKTPIILLSTSSCSTSYSPSA